MSKALKREIEFRAMTLLTVGLATHLSNFSCKASVAFCAKLRNYMLNFCRDLLKWVWHQVAISENKYACLLGLSLFSYAPSKLICDWNCSAMNILCTEKLLRRYLFHDLLKNPCSCLFKLLNMGLYVENSRTNVSVCNAVELK